MPHYFALAMRLGYNSLTHLDLGETVPKNLFVVLPPILNQTQCHQKLQRHLKQ